MFPHENAADQPSGRDQGGRRQFPGGRDSRPDGASGSAPGSLVQKPLWGDQVLQKKEEDQRELGMGVTVSWGGACILHQCSLGLPNLEKYSCHLLGRVPGESLFLIHQFLTEPAVRPAVLGTERHG